jgi:hypothetical protein
MNSNTISVSAAARVLPANPNLEHLKNEAKKRLAVLCATTPNTQLAEAQFQLAREYGFKSWRDLKAFVDKQANGRATNAAVASKHVEYVGDWIGELGKEARIALHIVRKDNGEIDATIDSQDTGQFDLPTNHLAADESQLSFGVYIPSPTGNYEVTYTGNWDATAQVLTGEWLSHGIALPFSFRRGAFPPAPIIDGIDGFWDGVLEAQGGYRLQFQIKTDSHGTFAWLDSPDRNNYRMPVTAVARANRQITLAMKTVTVTGELSDDDQTLQAQFIRGGTTVPLTLTRRPRGAPVPVPRNLERAVVAVALETLNKYVGVYSLGPDRTLSISTTNGSLYAQFPNQPSIQLFASSPTEFFWKQFEASVRFELANGNALALVMRKNGRDTRAVRIGVSTDPIMVEIMSAIAVLRGGDRSGGRSQLAAIWSRIADNPEPMHECALSHSMADTQDDLADELAWDIRALNAALRCTDTDAQRHSEAPSIAAFMPSLHVNLAEDYFKLSDIARSKDHLASARIFLSALPDNAYAQLIRGGIERLAKHLDAYGQ